jgi:ribosomal protein L32
MALDAIKKLVGNFDRLLAIAVEAKPNPTTDLWHKSNHKCPYCGKFYTELEEAEYVFEHGMCLGCEEFRFGRNDGDLV